MSKTDEPGTAEDVGFRFLLFRKAIRRTRSQLASEMGVSQRDIAAVENGAEFPGIDFLHYLKQGYGLNINWLLCKDGDMFASIDERPPEVDTDYAMKPRGRYGDPGYRDYLEFFQLMQIPVIKKAVMERLAEVKEQIRKKAGEE